jgi:1,4-dihydroxy-2-naphthoate octaprenyltransferase
MKQLLVRFWGYVEIRTKIASVLPFLLGIFYAAYTYRQINAWSTGLFFVSMLFFDMATTALNNYIDTKTNGAPLQFTKKTAKLILWVLLALATIFGLLLAWRAGPVVLVCGALCFLIGIVYTFGPAPISRMPLGEIFSGLFMGFFIPFLVVFINAPTDRLAFYTFTEGVLQISFRLPDLLKLAILTIPLICGIANIMLANNICDVEHDIKVNRFTLPYYIGKKHAIQLFAALNLISYVAILAMAIFQILPIFVLLAMPTAILVWKNVRSFADRQSKPETFPLSVANLVLMTLPLILVAAIGFLIGR